MILRRLRERETVIREPTASEYSWPSFLDCEAHFLPASRTLSLTPPTAFWTLPAVFSAAPSARVFESPVIFPTVSFTEPFACLAAPLTRSLSILSLPFQAWRIFLLAHLTRSLRKSCAFARPARCVNCSREINSAHKRAVRNCELVSVRLLRMGVFVARPDTCRSTVTLESKES